MPHETAMHGRIDLTTRGSQTGKSWQRAGAHGLWDPFWGNMTCPCDINVGSHMIVEPSESLAFVTVTHETPNANTH